MIVGLHWVGHNDLGTLDDQWTFQEGDDIHCKLSSAGLEGACRGKGGNQPYHNSPVIKRNDACGEITKCLPLLFNVAALLEIRTPFVRS